MTQVAKSNGKQSMAQFLAMGPVSDNLEKTLKDKKSMFVSNLISMTEGDPKLQECDPGILMKCAMNATALDLSLNKNLGHAYIVAYKGVPSFQLGFKGLIQLAIRSGQYKHINAVEVREGEIKRNKFTQAVEVIGENPEGKIIGYLATLVLLSGFEASVYMTEEEIEAHARKYSQAYKSDIQYKSRRSPWSDPTERIKMANKTVLKALLSTYGVLSMEMQEAMANDKEETVDVKAEDVTYTQSVTTPVDPTEKQAPKKMNLSDV